MTWTRDQETREMGRRRQNRALPMALFAALLLMLGATLPAAGQAVYGSVFGTVTDKSGAVVPNATITVTDISKGTATTVQTNETGEYRVQHLIPDTYRIEAAAKGFSSGQVDNVVVYADTAPEVNLQLEVGSVGTTVTVSGGAPLLQTDRADVATILNERAVENLPNLNRNFTAFELPRLAPPISDGGPAKEAAILSAASPLRWMGSFPLPRATSLTVPTIRSR